VAFSRDVTLADFSASICAIEDWQVRRLQEWSALHCHLSTDDRVRRTDLFIGKAKGLQKRLMLYFH
jgi:hypothetical protein